MYSDPTGNIAGWIIALIVIGVTGIIVGSVNAAASVNQGDSAGEVVLNFFIGLSAGIAVAGVSLLLIGVIGALATGVVAVGSTFITFAALGAAAMTFGSTVLGALSGVTPPEFEAFPEPGTVPVFPPSIIG